MINPLGHWLRILFGTRSRIPLRGLSGFRVPPGLVVTERLPLPFYAGEYAVLATGAGMVLILVQHDHLHQLDQTWTCHFRKMGSETTTALMTLHWGVSSSPHRSPCLVDFCNQAYHIQPIFNFLSWERV